MIKCVRQKKCANERQLKSTVKSSLKNLVIKFYAISEIISTACPRRLIRNG